MRQRAKLFAVVGIVGLLGCAADVVATVEPEAEAEPEDRVAIAPEPLQLIDAEHLRRVEIEQALDEDLGYWRCAHLSARIHRTAWFKTVSVAVTLVNDESGEAARLVLDPMPGEAILRACLSQALASMRFAPTSAPVRVTRKLELGPSHEGEIAAKLAELALEGLSPTDPGESSCPGDRTERCETVSFDAIIDNALYVAEPSGKDIAAAKGTNVPDALDVTLHFCVEPTSGRISRIRRSHPGPGQPVVDRLIAAVGKWRVRPLELAGKPILACSHVDFSIAFSQPVEVVEPGPAKPPLAVVPAQAIYTPAPHWKAFRSLKLGYRQLRVYRGQSRVLRWWGYNTTAFCIGVNGRVQDVRTLRKFPGNPEVDAIIRATIEKWRFKPLLLAGEPHEVCTERSFRIEFEAQ